MKEPRRPLVILALSGGLILLLIVLLRLFFPPPPPDPRPPEPNSIGDFVYGDFSGSETPCNGSQVGNSGNGLSGVTVELWAAGALAPMDTDTTSAESGYVGRYRFYDVPNSPAAYTVKVVKSTLPATVDQNSKPNEKSVMMTADAAIQNADFGFCAP